MGFIEQNKIKGSECLQAQSNPDLCFSAWNCESSKLNSLSQDYYSQILDMLPASGPTASTLLTVEFYFGEKVFKQKRGLEKRNGEKALCLLTHCTFTRWNSCRFVK
jgi:hypothetical protein